MKKVALLSIALIAIAFVGCRPKTYDSFQQDDGKTLVPIIDSTTTGVVTDVLVCAILPPKPAPKGQVFLTMIPFHNVSAGAMLHSLAKITGDEEYVINVKITPASLKISLKNGKTMEIPACKYVGQELKDTVYAKSGLPIATRHFDNGHTTDRMPAKTI